MIGGETIRHTRVFNAWFFGRPKIVGFGGPGGAGGPENPFQNSGVSLPSDVLRLLGRGGGLDGRTPVIHLQDSLIKESKYSSSRTSLVVAHSPR